MQKKQIKKRKKTIIDDMGLDPSVLKHLGAIGFNIEALRIGGSVPMPLLIEHLDKHAASVAYWCTQEERCQHKLNLLEDAISLWEKEKFDKFNNKLSRKASRPSAKAVESAIAVKHKKKIQKFNTKLRKLQYKLSLIKVVAKSWNEKGWDIRAIKDIKLREESSHITIGNPRKDK